ncbi:hypothetical protein [Pseudomonas sp. TH31]|uniref:hypothetical protein n=1 Tax=Pseudomonas sp. TH31 TaxID=2796396 RepID=UPI0019122F5A|nr:hypothetical protein [Pseudomonas sp. TH31]MBK5417841.1 hypothetical protein [Pseudomonas sp. TH31]
METAEDLVCVSRFGEGQDQKIAAFGSAHRRVGAAEGRDLLILILPLIFILL